MQNTKFLSDSNIIPNIQVPDGCELFFNETTKHWVLRNCKGFSAKYLKKNPFVPHSKYEEVAIEPLFEDDITIKISKGHNNENLTTAKREKNDDFYTTFDDISKEMNHYREYLKGKVVFCPCDKVFNEGRSEFVNYFTMLFHELGLKKVIFSQYNPHGAGYKTEWELEKCGYKWEYNGEFEDNRFVDESEIDFYPLKGNGSFDSRECREIMKECDIVITNPPFSRFRDFIEQLIKMDKKFIVIGSENSITYKGIFPLIKDNKMWLGFSKPSAFRIPIEYIDENNKSQFVKDGVVYQQFGNICWFTNLEHEKRIEKIPLIKKYNPDEYPHYDNYDAIEVGSYKDIPVDYDDIIGVPISYLQHHNPNQFEIVGAFNYSKDYNGKNWSAKLFGKNIYKRLLIKKISESNIQ